MFKKPKKNPKDKFRSKRVSEGDYENETETNETFPNNKRSKTINEGESYSYGRGDNLSTTRGRQEDATSGDGDHVYDGDDDPQEISTFSLLQRAKLEQQQKIKSSAAAKVVKFQNSNHRDRKDKKKVMMQQYDVTKSDQISQKDLATRTAEYHPQETKKDEDGNDDKKSHEEGKKLYKGNQEPRNKFLAGPLKAPTFIRTTSRFDYQPDICKDYKETGFCGFGDSCIYLHDRGNTLTGWQLDEQYEKMKKIQQEQKMREMEMFCQEISGNGGGGDEDVVTAVNGNLDGHTTGGGTTDDLPFACYLCRQPFTDPVLTTCNHYFCQKCIMQHVKEYGKSGRNGSATSSPCPICQKDTHGVFNYPNKLYQKKRRMGCSTWEEFAKKSSGQS